MTLAVKLNRPKSLADLATEEIRAAVVNGRLAFGAQLSEGALAANLGISKTPVREALLRLKAEGLVDVHPQRGTFVFRPTEAEVEDICRFREIIEVAGLGVAAAQRRRELIALLDAKLAEMREAHAAHELRRLPRLDQEFHEAILACCDNAYLRDAYDLVAYKIRALRCRLPEASDRVEHCQENHAVIADAVRRGSIVRAQSLLASHIRDTLASYLEASRNTAPVALAL